MSDIRQFIQSGPSCVDSAWLFVWPHPHLQRTVCRTIHQVLADMECCQLHGAWCCMMLHGFGGFRLGDVRPAHPRCRKRCLTAVPGARSDSWFSVFGLLLLLRKLNQGLNVGFTRYVICASSAQTDSNPSQMSRSPSNQKAKHLSVGWKISSAFDQS